ncbi:lysophospholipid acyltransferase family protein [Ruegeria sp. 2205SS24-7]|uniref:lysophospholipid acyltransferase family protein n=1 Tax=Ruegeria discodermiae TaxID=3064389 RepID=UPI002740A3B5|nr:lysophospholipid acyltransferase family protein [Ruegeria sp. 2205SS24-7]MDP5217454.1 lysophospholipid acyltransferase family protein [Ruegeria sp. 2205SS24-7]
MALQWIRSLIFKIVMYAWMAVLGILFSPYALLSKNGALRACKLYARSVIWMARWMVGLHGEVRGEVPTGEVVIAAKHQSFFDIILIFDAVPRAKFIMKRELLWTPFIGLYAKRLGCIPVDRGKKGAAVAKMVKDVAAEFSEPGQLVIYPQGTRVAPGVHKKYKVGTAILYEGLEYPCVPAATNVGVFWPRTGVLRKPGTATVEFLPTIAPGTGRDTFMSALEQAIESRSNALMHEVGFDPNDAR